MVELEEQEEAAPPAWSSGCVAGVGMRGLGETGLFE